ncbi:MAG: hypothetical protein AAGC55_31870, partial [Myxococcota bacterium]
MTALLAALAGCPGTAPRTDEQSARKSQTRLDLARDFLSKRQIEPAETEAGKAIALDPNNEEAHQLLGLIDLLRGLDAQHLLEIEECLSGVDADALRAEKDGYLAAAELHFAQAVTIDPEYGESWATRGLVAMLLTRYDNAVEYLTRALGLPARINNIPTVRANLGWAYFLDDELISAAKELRQALQFSP